jgi:protein ImuA
VLSLKINRLETLRQRLRTAETPPGPALPVLSLGAAALDTALPWGGLPRGCLHELVAAPGDAAAAGLAAVLLGKLMGPGGLGMWGMLARGARTQGQPYAHGLARFGVTPERLVLVQAPDEAALLWAMEEALRARRFAAVLGEDVAPDLTATRRLQLAAAAGETTALLAAPPRQGRISAAVTRWRAASLPADGPACTRWHLTLERCRGGAGGAWPVEWTHETLSLRVLAALAGGAVAAASS